MFSNMIKPKVGKSYTIKDRGNNKSYLNTLAPHGPDTTQISKAVFFRTFYT